jgi:phosphate/sulfate permease
VHGFSAETAAAGSILMSSFLGIPVSTTHTITGAIIGVGATSRLSAIRWGLAYRIVWAWILTFLVPPLSRPCAGTEFHCCICLVEAIYRLLVFRF